MNDNDPGAADTLYGMATRLSASGRLDEARGLLTQAAELGHPQATYALASCLAGGIGGGIDKPGAMDLLRRIAKDLPQARQMMALGTALRWTPDGSWQAALEARIGDAEAGDTLAMTEIGLLIGLEAPDDTLADHWFERAAASGEPAAIAASARRHLDRGRTPAHWAMRHAILDQVNHPLAPYFEQHFRDLPVADPVEPGDLNSARVRDRLADLPPPDIASAPLDGAPAAQVASGCLPAVLCDYALARYTPRLRPLLRPDVATGKAVPDPDHPALSAALPLSHQDLVLHAIEHRLAAIAGSGWAHVERLRVFVYRDGDAEPVRHDAVDPDNPDPAIQADYQRAGQRPVTVYAALNEGYGGGAILFDETGGSWTGRRGDALIIRNTDDSGTPEPAAAHSAQPVTQGWRAVARLGLRERSVLPANA